MRLWCAGFNGFGQWGDLGHQIHQFKQINLKKCLNLTKKKLHFEIDIEWGYNVFILDTKILVKGFHKDNFDQTIELSKPVGAIFTDCVCNDKFILFYNKKERYVWKYHLDGSVEQEWVKLSNFLDSGVEKENNARAADLKHEKIAKIVSSICLSIALTSKGRIFGIPYEIDTKHCRGRIIDIDCGHEHAILLTDRGYVYTWGNGSRCQLGLGDTKNYDQPELVKALTGIKIVKIAAGGWHCCVISDTGDLYTWGWNEKGQLGVCVFNDKFYKNDSLSNNDGAQPGPSRDTPGDGYSNTRPKNLDDNIALPNYALPQLVDIYDEDSFTVLEKNIVDVDCGSKHTIIKLEDNSFWGAGCNSFGQLGFDNDYFQYVNNFVKLNVSADDATIKCGIWSTAIISKT